MKFKLLGNTTNSLAFRAIDETDNYNDYGIFDFPEIIDENGNIIQQAKPYFTQYFGKFFTTGKFVYDENKFDEACANYIYYVVEWLYPTTGRIIIPNQIILDDPNIRALIDYCDTHNIKYSIFEVNTQVYVSFLYQEHYDLLHQYPSVVFEGHIDIVPTALENQ